MRLALAGAEVVIEDVCASSTSSPSDSSKNSFPTSSAIYVTDRVLKQLVKNLVFTFEFISREKCAVLRVVGLYRPVYNCALHELFHFHTTQFWVTLLYTRVVDL